VEYVFFARLFAWAKRRHPNKSKWWIVDQYWRITKGKGWRFQPPGSDYQLYQHRSTPIRRHVKVQGHRSPYDGDWLYWSTRLGKHPEVPLRVTRLLKRQRVNVRLANCSSKTEMSWRWSIPYPNNRTETVCVTTDTFFIDIVSKRNQPVTNYRPDGYE